MPPTLPARLRPRSRGVAQEIEEATFQAGEELVVEVAGLQGRRAPHLLDREVREHPPRAADGRLRPRVRPGLDPEPAVGALEERGDGPVAAVLLREERASVLEFRQRLEELVRLLDRADLVFGDPGQVDDRDVAGRYSLRLVVRQRALDHAAQPVRRAGARRWVVGAIGEDRQSVAQQRNERFPLLLLIGPEDSRRRDLIVLRVRPSGIERVYDGVQNSCHPFAP